jgi:hypothetical protein
LAIFSHLDKTRILYADSWRSAAKVFVFAVAACLNLWRDYMASLPFRVILAATALALFWQWIAAPIVIAARLLVSATFFPTLLTLPIRTAASIPFGICALLGLMLWQGRKRELATTLKTTNYGIGAD